ncbi:MAG: hypothetical protein MZV63_64585 [Marinilabiliales bacterium]|nr:hypothetical protein [Marinilabiliales bacterium]
MTSGTLAAEAASSHSGHPDQQRWPTLSRPGPIPTRSPSRTRPTGPGTRPAPVSLTVATAGVLAVTPAGGLTSAGPHWRSVHALEPGLYAPEHGRFGHRLDQHERPGLDDSVRRRRGPWPPARRPRSRSRSIPRPTRWPPGPTPIR